MAKTGIHTIHGKCIATTDILSNNREIDAKLIAAAPDLLEALQNCLSALKAFGANNEWIEVIEANKAINKALS